MKLFLTKINSTNFCSGPVCQPQNQNQNRCHSTFFFFCQICQYASTFAINFSSHLFVKVVTCCKKCINLSYRANWRKYVFSICIFPHPWGKVKSLFTVNHWNKCHHKSYCVHLWYTFTINLSKISKVFCSRFWLASSALKDHSVQCQHMKWSLGST